jgi:hypothetical protein
MHWLKRAHPELVGRYEELYRDGSEMQRTEYDRLMDLVRPRGRTWDQRVREYRQTAAQLREAPADASDRQETLFE